MSNSEIKFRDARVDTKVLLAILWTSLLGLYIYCDIFSLYRPGTLEGIAKGRMGPFGVSQVSLFLASLLMLFPILMSIVSVSLKARATRLITLCIAPLYFLVNVGNLLGEGWAYYFLFGIAELLVILAIFLVALKWPGESREARASA